MFFVPTGNVLFMLGANVLFVNFTEILLSLYIGKRLFFALHCMIVNLQQLEKNVTRLERDLQLTKDESNTKQKEQQGEIERLQRQIESKQTENSELLREVQNLKEQVQLLQDDNEYMEEQMKV